MSNLAPETDASDAAAERREARLRATRTLTRIGLKIAEALEQDLDALNNAPATVAPGGDANQQKRDIARAFAQVSRAVSLNMALEERLDQAPEVRRLEAEARAARAKAEAARADAARADAALPRRKQAVEAPLRRAVSDAAPFNSQRHCDLTRALNDALDRELLALDRFLDRPAEETIARIARGLGLAIGPDSEADQNPDPNKVRRPRTEGAKATGDPGTRPGAFGPSPKADRSKWRPPESRIGRPTGLANQGSPARSGPASCRGSSA